MASMGGGINIDSSETFTIGGVVAINNGTMKNVNQSGMGGSLYVSLARSLSCNIGSFVGHNTGSIENSFSERAVMINLSQGDNTYLKNITGESPKFFRFPYGAYNLDSVLSVEKQGMIPIQWDVDSLDWKGLNETEILKRIQDKVKGGSIILFHNNL